MHRRDFLSSAAAGSALALSSQRFAEAQTGPTSVREYYELRKYELISGPQTKLTQGYVAEALIPALNRMGMKPIGAFDLYIGPQTPSLYVLIPSASLDSLVMAELNLAKDEEYQKAASSFLSAPAKEPAYARMESQLLVAFDGHPKLTVPPPTAQRGPRVFQLRTYESPSNNDHRIKVEMFHKGEFSIFEKAGFWQVFYGDALIGPRLPHLTYMLSFPDLSEMNAMWKNFQTDSDWKKLSSSSTYSFESIVSNIDSLILNPTSYSQV